LPGIGLPVKGFLKRKDRRKNMGYRRYVDITSVDIDYKGYLGEGYLIKNQVG